MSKYKPLERHLRAAGKPRIALTFPQIEKILGGPGSLPASARSWPAWWSNNGGSHVQAQAWIQAGYKTEQVDIAGQRVVFVADDSISTQPSDATGTATRGATPSVFGSMRGTTFVMPGVDLTQPTTPEWGKLQDE